MPRSGAGRGNDHKRAACFDIIISAVALGADDLFHICGIAFDDVVDVTADAEGFQLFAEQVGSRLSGVLGNDDAAYIQTDLAEGFRQAEHFQVIGQPEVAAGFVGFQRACGDGDDDFCLILELEQHFELAVRLEAGQDSGSVIVVEKLTSEFQIELVAEHGNPLADMFGLHLQILLIIKSNIHMKTP